MRAWIIALNVEAEAVRSAVPREDRLYLSGVGKVNAAIAAARALAAGADELVNVGLCGGFGAGMKIGDVYEVARAVEYDFDLSAINGTCIGQLNERTSPYFELSVRGDPRWPAKILATGDRFVDSDADLGIFRQLGAELRDMEGAAVAHVAEAAGVPCRELKCVSDVYGRGSMTMQFVSHTEEALKCLHDAVISWR